MRGEIQTVSFKIWTRFQSQQPLYYERHSIDVLWFSDCFSALHGWEEVYPSLKQSCAKNIYQGKDGKEIGAHACALVPLWRTKMYHKNYLILDLHITFKLFLFSFLFNSCNNTTIHDFFMEIVTKLSKAFYAFVSVRRLYEYCVQL